MDIPGAELVWVPGGGHVLILERPGLVNDAIRAMIQRAGDGGLPRSA
jgi:pimeloyl-ACP methyl ester carboxylesterase